MIHRRASAGRYLPPSLSRFQKSWPALGPPRRSISLNVYGASGEKMLFMTQDRISRFSCGHHTSISVIAQPPFRATKSN